MPSRYDCSPFALRHQSVALLTRHAKEKLLAPLFHDRLDCKLIHTDAIDTDTLGTFTREIARPGSQLEAARKKAELGAELTGCRYALASEGAFISDPWTGMMPWNLEMVLLLDRETGDEITGIAQGPAMSLHETVRDWTALEKFAARAGFPSHHLVLRADHADNPPLAKGIANPAQLHASFEQVMSQSQQQQVFIENDLRAHCNPTRQAIIVNAADNLLDRLQSKCPECQQPNFWITETIKGKPCRLCGAPTNAVQADKWSCAYCPFDEIRPRETSLYADPATCDFCNP